MSIASLALILAGGIIIFLAAIAIVTGNRKR